MEINESLYTSNYSNINEWIELVMNRKIVYPQLRIPYEEWLDDYIENIGSRSLEEVKDLLRCLLNPINRKLDVDMYKCFLALKNSDISEHQKYAEQLFLNENYKRLEKGYDAWEGITWVLELLPHSPYQAVCALEGYSYSQVDLPDDRVIGLQQCIRIIRERFIYLGKSNRDLLKLKPIEFEWLIEELYSRMGYKTSWTKATRDGGKDIVASIQRTDGIEYVYIECKLYDTTELRNTHVKTFAYTVNDDKINRGIIFCTGYANNALKKIDKRITILTYGDICVLLNSHLGSDWDDRLSSIIEYKRNKYSK